MQAETPYLWPYSPANSPLPLPESPILVTNSKIYYLKNDQSASDNEAILDLTQIQHYCGKYSSEGVNVEQLLEQNSAPLMSDRKPFLLLGELANPFQLNRLNIGAMPVFLVRLEGLCRTYADALDSRMIQPGVHQITIARSPGWWEKSHIAMATIDQMKAMVNWLSNGQKGAWRPVKPAEGKVRFESNPTLIPPELESMDWDGISEIVTQDMPEANGPSIDLKEIMIPIHTKWGCYDSRERIIRCVHVGQREFHTDYFRRGSSKKWQDVLEIQ